MSYVKTPAGRSMLALAVLFSTACGCSATARSSVTHSVSDLDLGSYSRLAVAVSSDAADQRGYVRQLGASVVGRLRDLRKLDRVYLQGMMPVEQEPDLELRIVVTSTSMVSDVTREWLGAFAGEGSLVATVELSESTGRALRAATVAGKAPVMSNETTRQAVEKVAAEIVRFVVEGK